jgi:hypothetical protein
MVGAVEELFVTERWSTFLAREGEKMSAAFGKSTGRKESEPEDTGE